MARAAKEIVVEAPLRSVYNQWTQFEEFPRFMEGVKEVRQLDDRHLFWRANIGGRDMEWEAEIQEQVPDQKIIWRSTSGEMNAGIVAFRPAGDGKTEVRLEMSYEPKGAAEQAGSALGIVEGKVEGDLKRFKEFIEDRGGHETGAWRGEIANEDAPGGHTQGVGKLDSD
ncbi:MAG: SRPBCC family protein [Dehalococcoidia bacterium]|nr:MAG: SRPBCC family protein [Dehalococcoidia bacterium]